MTIDIDAIRKQWLNQCGPCDAGLGMECSHPDADERPVIAALCEEIEQLRAKLADAPPAWATFTADDMHGAGLEAVAAEMGRDAARAELDRVRADLAAAHNHAHRQDTEIQRLTRDGTAYANENARLRSKLADLEDVGRCDHDAGLDVECRPRLVETYGQREAEVAR